MPFGSHQPDRKDVGLFNERCEGDDQRRVECLTSQIKASLQCLLLCIILRKSSAASSSSPTQRPQCLWDLCALRGAPEDLAGRDAQY